MGTDVLKVWLLIPTHDDGVPDFIDSHSAAWAGYSLSISVLTAIFQADLG